MDRQKRLRILRQGLATSTSPVCSLTDYKRWLRQHGYGDYLADSTLYTDIQEVMADKSWLKANLEYLARQKDNLNVSLGATNKLLEVEDRFDDFVDQE